MRTTIIIRYLLFKLQKDPDHGVHYANSTLLQERLWTSSLHKLFLILYFPQPFKQYYNYDFCKNILRILKAIYDIS